MRNYDGLIVDLRHAQRALGVPMDGFNGMEWARRRHAEHLQRAGLGSRAGQLPQEPTAELTAAGDPHRAFGALAAGVAFVVAGGPFDIALFNTPRPPTGEGKARLYSRRRRSASAVTADGHASYDIRVTRAGLPAPRTLGEYTAYVAWAATTDLSDGVGSVSWRTV